MGNAFPFESEDGVCLAAAGNLERGVTVKGRHLYLGTEGSLGKVERQLVEDIIVVPGENFMLGYRYGNVKIASGTAPGSGVTFTTEPYLGAAVNSGGYIDQNAALLLLSAGAFALGAGLGNNAALTPALGAGSSGGKAPEDTLLDPAYLSAAVAVRAAAGLTARFAAGTVAQ